MTKLQSFSFSRLSTSPLFNRVNTREQNRYCLGTRYVTTLAGLTAQLALKVSMIITENTKVMLRDG